MICPILGPETPEFSIFNEIETYQTLKTQRAVYHLGRKIRLGK